MIYYISFNINYRPCEYDILERKDENDVVLDEPISHGETVFFGSKSLEKVKRFINDYDMS